MISLCYSWQNIYKRDQVNKIYSLTKIRGTSWRRKVIENLSHDGRVFARLRQVHWTHFCPIQRVSKVRSVHSHFVPCKGTKCPGYEVAKVRSVLTPRLSSRVIKADHSHILELKPQRARKGKDNQFKIPSISSTIYEQSFFQRTLRNYGIISKNPSYIDSKSHQIFKSNYIHNLARPKQQQNKLDDALLTSFLLLLVYSVGSIRQDVKLRDYLSMSGAGVRLYMVQVKKTHCCL